jgi:hypothetical protein
MSVFRLKLFLGVIVVSGLSGCHLETVSSKSVEGGALFQTLNIRCQDSGSRKECLTEAVFNLEREWGTGVRLEAEETVKFDGADLPYTAWRAGSVGYQKVWHSVDPVGFLGTSKCFQFVNKNGEHFENCSPSLSISGIHIPTDWKYNDEPLSVHIVPGGFKSAHLTIRGIYRMDPATKDQPAKLNTSYGAFIVGHMGSDKVTFDLTSEDKAMLRTSRNLANKQSMSFQELPVELELSMEQPMAQVTSAGGRMSIQMIYSGTKIRFF